ncbi:MAG: tRNA nucleotidyltransferase [Ignavibacteria bacterium RIFOXYB2_FULL_35_12]|nr:MAG: tRNA nucleotidyltransferase [Ignavibacteria bacterium GWA2_36_19]OGU59329.1 MAG: tRNA nucleotidyltransferase [Ignavibacteria bacterium GWF2_35_20]OGU80454.1 MAG: tRNA nucleotidyltransferase [Ignavibacteria bacterium RIFOXYA2_FULL_35_9]OGU86478.1 MAG: tRNA nucleotidyltransferase [Ignavibacteria bacterium RIFOXYA12_FULL_35_25]OGU92357.1 MAG: tRNA nucleotidyltransferase [Ignavibacteria bacterium RIFOXYC12_FULL_35_11]OGU97727.1 MAG: tRNA nucleotidyltransferase [Ignavibacteria bacterium RIF
MNFKEKIKQYSFLDSAMQIAKRMNYKVFLVGGYVRDLILKRESLEMDLLVLGDGIEFANEYAKELGIKSVTVYKNFGTAHFKYEDFNLEFVGARKESYSKDSRKPEVVLGSFTDDISRRDFTINTFAISLNEKDFGELIDRYDGMNDIRNKLIRTPIDPLITFDDDPLRIMRAFRFASQLDFKVHNSILYAANKLRERLKIVSQERITDELMKIMASPQPSIGIKLLHNSGVMEIIFPEISNLSGVDQRNDYHHKDVFLHTCMVVDNVAKISDDIWLRLVALLHDIAKPQTKKFVEEIGWTFHGHDEIGARMMKGIFKRLKLPMNKLEYVEKLIRLHLRPIALAKDEVTDSAIRRLIVDTGDDLNDLINLCRADITSKDPNRVTKYLYNYERVMKKVFEVLEKDKLRAFQSPVRGEEIMQICNLKPSKKVGEIKKAIEEAILDGKIGNNYEEAYEYLFSIKEKYLSNNI